MPVHNALPHLDAAVESILNQTFGDFEFVILNDASTDGSSERLREWAVRDKRIRLLEVKENLGPVHSSNMVARAARAPLVARMDADDISHPARLAEGVAFLREHPEVGLVASVCDMIDAAGNKVRGPELWRLTRRSPFVPFAHGAMIYRREIFDRVGGYREECEYWEDQDLVVRMSAVTKVAITRLPRYRVRQSRTSTRFISDQERMERALGIMYESTDRLARTLDHDWVADGTANRLGKVDPRVFISIGSVRLWAGGNPKLFARLLKRGDLSWNFRTLSALVWTAWASISPSSLRSCLMMLLRIRNRLAARSMAGSEPLLWHPVSGATELPGT